MGYCKCPMNKLFRVLWILLFDFILFDVSQWLPILQIYFCQISHSYVLMLFQLNLTLSRMLIEIESKICELTKSVGLLTVDRKFTVSDFCALINGIHFLNLGRSRIFPFDNAIVLPRSGRCSARVRHHQVRWCTVRPFFSFDSQFYEPIKYGCVQIAYQLNSSSTVCILLTDHALCCRWLWANVRIYFFCFASQCQHWFFITKTSWNMLFRRTWAEF